MLLTAPLSSAFAASPEIFGTCARALAAAWSQPTPHPRALRDWIAPTLFARPVSLVSLAPMKEASCTLL